MLKSSSYSRYDIFRQCPLKARLKFIEKVPDPRPPSTKEDPGTRGIRIHALAEEYVKGEIELHPDLKLYADQLLIARKLFNDNMAELEMPIGLDRNWQRVSTTDFDNCVYRAVIDLYLRPDKQTVMVVDYKTGKRKDKQVVHTEQLMEYAATIAATDEQVQHIICEIWYLDHGPPELNIEMTREEALKYNAVIRRRTMEVLSATEFPAYPSHNACLWCPFKKGLVGRGRDAYAGTGHCSKNVA